jgi:hypothetical protein
MASTGDIAASHTPDADGFPQDNGGEPKTNEKKEK